MNSIDFGIVLCALLYLLWRKRMSFLNSLLVSVAVFTGYAIGFWLSPSITGKLASDLQKGIVSLCLGFGLAVAFGAASTLWARKFRVSIIQSSFFTTDKRLCLPYKFISIIIAVLLLTQTLIYVPLLSLQFVAQGSTILRFADRFLPATLLEKRSTKIAPDQFHNLRLAYDANPLTYNHIQDAGVFQPAVNAVAASVVKISGNTCLGIGSGSGFVAGKNLVITNAHVVNGSSTIYISDHDGSYPATPILIDRDVDIAVLYSKFITSKPLEISSIKAPPGTATAILGYPGAGDLRFKHAISTISTFTASNIKLNPDNTITLGAVIMPGNSGGPVINKSGQVIGVATGGGSGDSVAVSSDVVHQLLGKAKKRMLPIQTGFCNVGDKYL